MSIVTCTGTQNAKSHLCSTINQEKTSQNIELDDLAVVVLDKHQPACEKAKVDAGADSPLLDKEASYSNTEKWDKDIQYEPRHSGDDSGQEAQNSAWMQFKPVMTQMNKVIQEKYRYKPKPIAKLSLQNKVYNFLERPTGWKCFIYHFTV